MLSFFFIPPHGIPNTLPGYIGIPILILLALAALICFIFNFPKS